MATPHERVYQSKTPMVAAAFGTVAFFFLGASCLIAAPSIAQKLVYGVIFLTTSAALYRYAQSKLMATDEGIRVSNPWSRYELSWEQIDRFELGRWKVNRAMCRVCTVEGSVRPAVGIAEGNFSTGSAGRMVDDLNDELARRIPRPTQRRRQSCSAPVLRTTSLL